MDTNTLRKNVSELLKNKSLNITGSNPKQPSRIIYNLKKDQLEKIINTKSLNWDDFANVIYKCENNKQDSNDQDSNGQDSNDNDSNSKFSFKELHTNGRLYVTTTGTRKTEEMIKDLRLNEFADQVEDGINHAIKLSKKAMESNGGSYSGDIKITIGNTPTIKLKNQHLHPVFEDVLFHLINDPDRNVYLFGSAGTGKTTMAQQLAESLGCERFALYSCSAGMSESVFTGKCLFDGTFFSTEFIDIVENGGLVLLDEFDAMDGNLAVYLNGLLANGILQTINNKDKQSIKRHPKCYIVGAGNTDGFGNGSRIYAGRNKLDGATLDRFTTFKFDYDKSLERKLSGGHTNLYKALQQIRKNVDKYEISRVVSTRQFLKMGIWMSAGKSLEYCIDRFISSWTEFEIEKCEIAGIIKSHNDSNGLKNA